MLRRLFQSILTFKSNYEEVSQKIKRQPIKIVSLSAKKKSICKSLYQTICPKFQQQLIYYFIDQTKYGNRKFHEAFLIDRQISYGEFIPQLRIKQELRVAALNIFFMNCQCQELFIEDNQTERKTLKKEGFKNVFSSLEHQDLNNYLKTCLKNQGQIENKSKPQQSKQLFDPSVSRVEHFLKSTLLQTSYPFSITPKSIQKYHHSRQLSSYIFRNFSNNKLYVVESSQLKQFQDEEQIQNKRLANFLEFVINPSSLVIPQNQMLSLLKFSKVKPYQNKKSIMIVHPLIPNPQNVSNLLKTMDGVKNLLKNGEFQGRHIVGVGSIIFVSLMLNQNLKENYIFDNLIVDINPQNKEIKFCRLKYSEVLNLGNYKRLEEQVLLYQQNKLEYFNLKNLHPQYLNEMISHCQDLKKDKLQKIQGVLRYYGWQFPKHDLLMIFQTRLQVISQFLKIQDNSQVVPFSSNKIMENSITASMLLLNQNYDYFMVAKQYNSFYMQELNFPSEQKPKENPFLDCLNKKSSFCIYTPHFKLHLFLQWIRSTTKYHAIQYLSMLTHTYQQYLILDKKNKFMNSNDNKSSILIVDHCELCPEIFNKPRNVRAVYVFRLKKIQNQELPWVCLPAGNDQLFVDSQDEVVGFVGGYLSGCCNYDKYQFRGACQILQKYIEFKCSLYNLNVADATLFLQQLHKAILNNKNRIKQLSLQYPQSYNLIYALPVFKINQKLFLQGNLLQILQVKYLLERIDRGGELELAPQENKSLTSLRKTIQFDTKQRAVGKLSKLLEGDLKETIQNDILDTIKALCEPVEGQPNKSDQLYYEFFAQIMEVEVSEIYQIQQLQNYLLVSTRQGLIIKHVTKDITQLLFEQMERIYFKIEKKNQSAVIHAIGDEKGVLSQKTIEINFAQQKLNLTTIKQKSLSEHPLTLLQSSAIKIEPSHGYFINHHKHQIQINVLDFQTTNKKQINLVITKNQELLSIKVMGFVDGCLLLVAVCQKSITIVMVSISDGCVIASQNVGVDNSLNILCQCIQKRLFISKGHNILTFQISKNSIQQQSPLCFNKQITAFQITPQNTCLATFQDEDSLTIYKLQPTPTIIQKYYWIQQNCRQIYHLNSRLFLKGQSNYIKTIEIRNQQQLLKKINNQK